MTEIIMGNHHHDICRICFETHCECDLDTPSGNDDTGTNRVNQVPGETSEGTSEDEHIGNAEKM